MTSSLFFRGSRLIAPLLVGVALALCATASQAAPAGATPERKIKIAFAGDSLVDNYWSGMTRALAANACLKNIVELGRYARNGTGLTRGDRVYWPREIAHIGATFQPTMFVISIGLNDRQFIVDANGARTPWGAPNWTDKYRQELEAFLKGAAASNAVVLLFGLPPMREDVDNNDALEKNRMFAEAVAKIAAPNVHYIEPWKLKDDGPNVFSSYGPGKNGKLTLIRNSDGQHFTVAGEDLLAGYLVPQVVRALAGVDGRVGECMNLKASEQQH